MNENADLIARIEAHCRKAKIAESTFGRLTVNDGKLIARLRSGGTITLETYRQIEAALKARRKAA
jgi:hypothetical protein